MTRDQYFAALRRTAEEVISLAEVKGSQYWDEDPYAAFREVGDLMGLSEEGALMTLASKHWGAVCKVASGKRRENPAQTQERVKDMVLYLLILHLMLGDNNEPD